MSPIVRLATLAATAFLSAAAATACTDSAAEPADSEPPAGNPGIVAGTLDVTAERSTLSLRNSTEFVVGYMVVDKDQLVVALYPPCGANCPKLVQGAQAAIPYSAIGGYTAASREATVLWWTFTRAADGTLVATGAVQSKTVRL